MSEEDAAQWTGSVTCGQSYVGEDHTQRRGYVLEEYRGKDQCGSCSVYKEIVEFNRCSQIACYGSSPGISFTVNGSILRH